MSALRIGILLFFEVQRNRTLPLSVRLLREAIKQRGDIPVLYEVKKCQMYFHGKKPEILYNNRPIRGCDVVICRPGISQRVDMEISVVKQFQMMGIPVLNGYFPVSVAKNKLRTFQVLTKNSIPVPRTIIVRRHECIDGAIDLIGGYPVILKSPFGAMGTSVALVESRRALYSALDVLWKKGSSILLFQEYIAEAEGADYRAFVVGDAVVAAMKRSAELGDFRSNLHRGGSGEQVKLTKKEENLAVRATKAIGLQVAGVDILRSKKGPIIIEVNSSPGMEIAHVTGINVAEAVVDLALAFAKKSKKRKTAKRS